MTDTTTMTDAGFLQVRWMIRRDMPSVLAIERASWEHDAHRQPTRLLGEEDFIRWLRQRNCIGMVAQSGEQVVGVMVYELQPGSLELLYLTVDPAHRRQGYGTAMIEKLRSKLSDTRRRRLRILVDERNLGGQLFLRALHIPCISTYYGLVDDDGRLPGDVYEFVHRHSSAPAVDRLLESNVRREQTP